MAVGTGTLWVLDFDGTLYRGGLARFAGGISNADLFVHLLFAPGSWARRWRFLRAGWGIARLNGSASRGESDAVCIEAFRSLLRREFRADEIWRAGEGMTGGLDGRALAVLGRWLQPDDRVMVLSKAFLPVLIPAGVRLSAVFGRGVEVVGNRLEEEGGILRVADKERELRAILADLPAERAVVVGDTEEELGLREVLAEAGIPARLLAVNPKDERLAKAADAVLSSWRQAESPPFA
ncbi:MAG: HAD family hydrolase [Lentisphaeria bacterium]|nr:HAD family hydrolase [Lentisphaeria bacterium]